MMRYSIGRYQALCRNTPSNKILFGKQPNKGRLKIMMQEMNQTNFILGTRGSPSITMLSTVDHSI